MFVGPAENWAHQQLAHTVLRCLTDIWNICASLCREIIGVSSHIHTTHINTLCGQNVQLLNVKLAVNIATTVL